MDGETVDRSENLSRELGCMEIQISSLDKLMEKFSGVCFVYLVISGC
jgi:hypothetical protein